MTVRLKGIGVTRQFKRAAIGDCDEKYTDWQHAKRGFKNEVQLNFQSGERTMKLAATRLKQSELATEPVQAPSATACQAAGNGLELPCCFRRI